VRTTMPGGRAGFEPEPTIYWRNRTSDGPHFHIDYCFVPSSWTNSISAVTIGPLKDWVGNHLSDHVPLIVDFNFGIDHSVMTNDERETPFSSAISSQDF
jgi:endonuclease/exonuclease/phosphatase family metal-dependent hydrolase